MPFHRPASSMRTAALLATRKSSTAVFTCRVVRRSLAGCGAPPPPPRLPRPPPRLAHAGSLAAAWLKRQFASSSLIRVASALKFTGTNIGLPTSTAAPATLSLMLSRYAVSSACVGPSRCGPRPPLRPASAAARAFRLRHFGALRHDEVERLGGDGALGARCPGQRLYDERRLHRRDDVRLDELVGPARMTEVPWFEMGVDEAPFRHLLRGPFGRRLVIRRSGQPRPIDVGQEMHRPHHLRILRLLLADLVVDGWIELRLRDRQRRDRDHDARREKSPVFHAPHYMRLSTSTGSDRSDRSTRECRPAG